MTEIHAHNALVQMDHPTIEHLAILIGRHHPHAPQVDYLPFAAIGVAGALLYSKACDLIGWALVGSGAAQTGAFADGADANAVQLGWAMSASANAAQFSLSPTGVRFHSGIQLRVVNGTVTGGVFYRPLRKG